MSLENDAAQAVAEPAPVSEAPAPVDAPPDAVSSPDDATLNSELMAIMRKSRPQERDETGRFRGNSTDQPAQAGTDQEAKVSPDQSPAAEQEQVKPAILPPASWSAEEKAEWTALPPKAQEVILRREREASQLISRQGTELKAYEPLRNVVEQNRDVFERNGIQPADGIGRLLAAERLLNTDPMTAISQLAQAYGVDLTAFGRSSDGGNTDHSASVLHREIANLKRELAETKSHVMTREQREAAQHSQTITTLIENFAKDKPEWAGLEQDVYAELTGINANIDAGILQPMTPDQKLARAWDRALRNNPEAWEKKQAAEKAEAEKKRIEEARKRVADAQRAKPANVNSGASADKTAEPLDDKLMAIIKRRKSNP